MSLYREIVQQMEIQRPPLPVPVHVDAADPIFTWPNYPAQEWVCLSGLYEYRELGTGWEGKKASELGHQTLGNAFEWWAGINADGSGSVEIGDEIGRLLVSMVTGGHNKDQWTRLIADLGEGEKYAEILMKIADSAGLLEISYVIYYAGLTDIGKAWAELFVQDAGVKERSKWAMR